MLTPHISFGPHADRSKLSPHSLDVLAELLTRSGNPGCIVTATVRSPADDARVVYDNLEMPGGVERARHLYKAPMQQVISVYVDGKRAGGLRDEIIARMAATILALGPYNCSHHCLTDEQLAEVNVIDVGPLSLADPDTFERECAGETPAGVLSKFLKPPNDPAFHLEIRQQPAGGA